MPDFDISRIMQNVKSLHGRFSELDSKLAKQEVVGESGAGLVKITLNGHYESSRVEIDPSIIDPDAPAVLQDLIAAAINDAVTRILSLREDTTKDFAREIGTIK